MISTARCCGESSFQHWWSSLRSPVWGWEPLILRRDLNSSPVLTTSNLNHPNLNHHTWETSPFQVSALLLPLSTWILLYILSYWCSVQLVFKWFNFDVVVGEDEHSIYLLSILSGSPRKFSTLSCFFPNFYNELFKLLFKIIFTVLK